MRSEQGAAWLRVWAVLQQLEVNGLLCVMVHNRLWVVHYR